MAEAVHIRVSFQIDADGLLSVTAREQVSGVEAHIEVKPSYGLGDTEISAMLQDTIGASQEDMLLRALREAQVDARRMLDATETALAEDAALLAPAEIKAIRHAMFMVGDMLETDQLDNAWGLDAQSRLACCVKVKDTDLTIEFPRHTRNHAREH